ncbi:Putative sensory transduction regulator [Paenibacillus sp. 1_12]|uniref:YbjN domain-containing protein n=1 Tax=Paenibacillus sp. 1_12 TaxID=1566278 RepID=UPI0008E9843C|nr:YbjN domain-containing protein [Paenibacillus sp. 1_12]SFL07765.1 Putative sensory transduction regulator [Paenibacillus sp. 1_12]
MENNETNAGTVSRVELDHPLVFTAITGDPIQVRIKGLKLIRDSELVTCSMVFEVDWPTYQFILAGEWFGMLPAAREGASGVSLDEDRPVELSASLRQSFVKAVLSNQADVEEVLQTLLQTATSETLPLRMSESWLIEEVKQQVELPDELVGGTLKQGYRTLWAEPTSAKPAAAQAKTALNEIVEGYLSSMEWSYVRIDDTILRLSFHGEQGQWTVLVRTDEEKQLCIVYSIYPELVAEQHRLGMALFLIEENYDLPIGNFEMDATDGELRYRTGIDVEHDRLSIPLFGQLFTTNIAIMDTYFKLIAEKMG